MKFARAGVVVLALLTLHSKLVFSGSASTQAPVVTKARTPVVVELFTSEGCSTCPPADALLARLENEQFVDGAEVIALEEHVDYWNHQGWTDPFSAAEWTLRQQEYAIAFKLDGVYTPQMVVGGQSQFIGSQLREVTGAVAAAARQPRTDITVIPETSPLNGALGVMVRAGKLEGNTPKDTPELWIAVTEKGLASAVARGENAGKNLRHASILRTLRKIGTADKNNESASFTGNVRVKCKSEWKRENLRIVVFMQERNSRRILGAASATVAD